MAEVVHDVISKRVSQDNAAIRTDQAQLETANRTLMGLVHHPLEMERQMGVIRDLTVAITGHRTRLTQATSDMGSLRQILQKYGTIAFLKRDQNFLSLYDNVEKSHRLKERLDDVALRVKYVSEMLVEVSDPETRQDYVVQQCLEGLKTSASDVTDLLASRAKIEELDETYRQAAAQKLKRHRRLIGHFLEELRDGGNNLSDAEPLVEANADNLCENLDSLLRALTNNDEPVSSGQYGLPAATMYRGGPSVGPRGGGRDAPPGTAVAPDAREGSMLSARSGSVLSAIGPTGQRVFGTGGTGGAAMPQPIHDDPYAHIPRIENEEAHHTFARFSSRLKVTHDMRRLTKPAAGIELSNTSALGAIGFRIGTGIHSYGVRIGEQCSRLLVGFADWNLPLDGYCNSLKYSGCYYLHVGNGTLWAPEQQLERKPFTYEAIGTSVGGVLRCVLDTIERTISFVWNDRNLGVAFRNVNLSRTLYPAFEVFSHGCSCEFAPSAAALGSSPDGAAGRTASPPSPR